MGRFIFDALVSRACYKVEVSTRVVGSNLKESVKNFEIFWLFDDCFRLVSHQGKQNITNNYE